MSIKKGMEKFMDRRQLVIKDIIKSTAADDNEKGNMIFNIMKEITISNPKCGVDIDFKDLQIINTAFLNNAIGRLFRRDSTIPLDEIRIVNYPKELKGLLDDVIEIAILKDNGKEDND